MAYLQDLEDAVLAHFNTVFASYIAVPNMTIVQGNMDLMIKNLAQQNYLYGIYFEFGGGSRARRESFSGREWNWFYNGGLYVKFRGDAGTLDQSSVEIIEVLRNLFKGSETLGGKTHFASLDSVSAPDPVLLPGDIPIYYISFRMTFMDKQ